MAKKLTQAHRPIAINTPLGLDKLTLLGFSGTEALSTLFEYEAELLSEDTGIALIDLVGQPVTIRVELDDEKRRTISGIVSRFVHTGFRRAKKKVGGSGGGGGEGEDVEDTLAEYRATIVPRMWLLTRRADCRIFKGKTVPQIVKQVCADIGLDVDDRALEAKFGPWDYCVQYRETDYNFIARLLEQEGIFYFFRHEEENHVLVLGDAPARLKSFEGYEEIRFMQPDSTTRDLQTIHTWSMAREIMPGRFAHKDFDFVAPDGLSPSIAQADIPAIARKHEIFDYPGEYLTPKEGDELAAVRLQELQVRSEVARGTSDSRGLVVGCLFKVTEHPREESLRTFLVASTAIQTESLDYESEGGKDRGAVLKVEFTAIDSARRFRPPRITPKPVIQGPQTAIVVGKPASDETPDTSGGASPSSGPSSSGGPPGTPPPPEEIATDEHGRVWVRFHWDRVETPSCPVRVAQVWAGKKWGGMYIPRIGQEVIVEFLEGDPDRPIITGRVYNGIHKPPYDLPTNKTMSTLKSSSSLGGEGFNEIRFQDKKGEEQLFVHGEKDLDARVKNDAREWIGHDRHVIVVNDRFEHVKANRHEKIGASHYEAVTTDRHVKVGANEVTEIGGKVLLKVADDAGEEFAKNRSTSVKEQLSVKAKIVVIEAEDNITLKVGKAYIAIERDSIKVCVDDGSGKIELDTKGGISIKSVQDTTVEATAKFSAKGTAGATLESPATTDVKGSSTTVKGDGMVTIQGAMVKIN